MLLNSDFKNWLPLPYFYNKWLLSRLVSDSWNYFYNCLQPIKHLFWGSLRMRLLHTQESIILFAVNYYSLIYLHLICHLLWDNVLRPCCLFQLPLPWESSEREKQNKIKKTFTLKYSRYKWLDFYWWVWRYAHHP